MIAGLVKKNKLQLAVKRAPLEPFICNPSSQFFLFFFTSSYLLLIYFFPFSPYSDRIKSFHRNSKTEKLKFAVEDGTHGKPLA